MNIHMSGLSENVYLWYSTHVFTNIIVHSCHVFGVVTFVEVTDIRPVTYTF